MQLDGPTSWQPRLNSRLEHVTVDLLERRNLSGIVVQGGGGEGQSWVESFIIRYSADDGDEPSWSSILDHKGDPVIFEANVDAVSHRSVDLGRLIGARHLQVSTCDDSSRLSDYLKHY